MRSGDVGVWRVVDGEVVEEEGWLFGEGGWVGNGRSDGDD